MFLYFEILYIYFLVFLNYLKTCVTRRERSDRHQKEKKIIFGIFENYLEESVTRCEGRTNTIKMKENFFFNFIIFKYIFF